eukprot:TRINITY_DN3127_c0_g1_i3.p1 TRINITY_DN3127_c0_g1~~TRINITY_DN3127_c0_g1_i3.p1  ORF type:complete len:973 (-),score=211.19 TRINITY_DN3127_c0_g1_i3:142-3030(-)
MDNSPLLNKMDRALLAELSASIKRDNNNSNNNTDDSGDPSLTAPSDSMANQQQPSKKKSSKGKGKKRSGKQDAAAADSNDKKKDKQQRSKKEGKTHHLHHLHHHSSAAKEKNHKLTRKLLAPRPLKDKLRRHSHHSVLDGDIVGGDQYDSNTNTTTTSHDHLQQHHNHHRSVSATSRYFAPLNLPPNPLLNAHYAVIPKHRTIAPIPKGTLPRPYAEIEAESREEIAELWRTRMTQSGHIKPGFHTPIPLTHSASLTKAEDWTEIKHKIVVSSLSLSSPGVGTSTHRSEAPPVVRLRRRLSWHLENTWDYEPYYWNVEKWKKKQRKLKAAAATAELVTATATVAESAEPLKGPHLKLPRLTAHGSTVFSEEELAQLSHMPTDWTTSSYLSDTEESEEEQDADRDREEVAFLDDATHISEAEWENIESGEGVRYEETDQTTSLTRRIIAGYPEALLSSLATIRQGDTEFIDDFLFTYRAFMSATDLFEFLKKRFFFLPPKGASTETVKLHHKYGPIVQLRVINVLLKWLTHHFYDFQKDKDLLANAISFIEGTIKATHEKWYPRLKAVLLAQECYGAESSTLGDYSLSIKSDLRVIEAAMQHERVGVPFHVLRKGKTYYKCFSGAQVIEWLLRNMSGLKSRDHAKEFCELLLSNKVLVSGRVGHRDSTKIADGKIYRFATGSVVSGRMPEPRVANKVENFIPKDYKELEAAGSDQLSVLVIHPVEIARQMTLYSEHLYSLITPDQLMNCAFLKKSRYETSPDFHNFADRSTHVSNWVAVEILSHANVNKRVACLRRFITIAEACSSMNNFFDCAAIICGLIGSAVARLRNTWKKIGRDYTKTYTRLEQLISPFGSYKNMRDAQRRCAPPIVPMLIMFTADLEHLGESPNQLENGMINFYKRRVEATQFKEMARCKSTKYLLMHVPVIYDWVVKVADSLPPQEVTSKALFDKSLTVEPRENRAN